MINTNIFLTFALCIISNFANVVKIPPEAIPVSTNDLAVFSIGRPFFPFDAYLQSKGGARFWLNNGTVGMYEYPAIRYFGLQNPADIPKFAGAAKLGSNEVVELANKTIRGLIKQGDPIANITPRVTVAQPFEKQPVPSYDITWALPKNPAVFAIARITVDARVPQIASVGLFDPAFWDMELFHIMTNSVCSSGTQTGASTQTNLPP